ncbi:MAG: multicopper oxidase domain-containing protein, partial [Candidatus Kapabacteria bacterium]|nr:multicopper oxidase domain-containing protein [Candidatus Kapabacteria bacterium]
MQQNHSKRQSMLMKRRSFVKGVAASAVLSLTSSISAQRLWAVTDHDVPHPLRFPPNYDGSEVAVGLGLSSIWNDVSTETYRFGGYPGVTIRRNTGETHSLVANNLLTTPLAIHWHGLDVPSVMDGHPMDAIPMGQKKEYRFQLKNRAGTYFYHSHSHERVGREVNRGLIGLFIVSDAEEQALNLPSGARD